MEKDFILDGVLVIAFFFLLFLSCFAICFSETNEKRLDDYEKTIKDLKFRVYIMEYGNKAKIVMDE